MYYTGLTRDQKQLMHWGANGAADSESIIKQVKFQTPCLLCVYTLSATFTDSSVCSLSAMKHTSILLAL